MNRALLLSLLMLAMGCTAPNPGSLLKEYTSPVKNAPTVLLLGKTAGRMDQVVRLIRDIGGVSVVGTFTEKEAMERLKTTPNVRLVGLGGAVENPTRERIHDYLKKNLPGVPTTEPGVQYPYSDENIRQDVKRKLSL
jgi:hypothetical protein